MRSGFSIFDNKLHYLCRQAKHFSWALKATAAASQLETSSVKRCLVFSRLLSPEVGAPGHALKEGRCLGPSKQNKGTFYSGELYRHALLKIKAKANQPVNEKQSAGTAKPLLWAPRQTHSIAAGFGQLEPVRNFPGPWSRLGWAVLQEQA